MVKNLDDLKDIVSNVGSKSLFDINPFSIIKNYDLDNESALELIQLKFNDSKILYITYRRELEFYQDWLSNLSVLIGWILSLTGIVITFIGDIDPSITILISGISNLVNIIISSMLKFSKIDYNIAYSEYASHAYDKLQTKVEYLLGTLHNKTQEEINIIIQDLEDSSREINESIRITLPMSNFVKHYHSDFGEMIFLRFLGLISKLLKKEKSYNEEI